ncbi:MAG: pyridoxal phosphate-dependent aminotransferase, partial [Candidatus Obscuribacterales bacterium]|nr:pyridoxal phosphate-dependent aminotransferase [Candidatus Obscuribacterales bacterium]
ELSFIINAPGKWIEGFDVASELTYSRIPSPSQLYYEWLFDDLLSFPFPVETIDSNYGNSKDISPERSEFIEAANDPVFAPKPVSTEDPDLIRLDYGEFEHSVPDLLVKGLIKGFVEPHSRVLPDVVRNRVASYMAATRRCLILPDRISLAQGVFPLFGAFIKTLTKRLGRQPVIALPGGSYGPLYPLIAYHGARVVTLKTNDEEGFLLTARMIRQMNEKPDVLWLTQPNNPSGLFFESGQVSSIIDACVEREIYLLADEIFFLLSDYRLGEWTPHYLSFGSFLDKNEPGKYIFLTDGLSKAFAAGGLRCGYMVCPDASFAADIQAHVQMPPAVILRSWDNLYSAFLDEAPHAMIDVGQANQDIRSYLFNCRKLLSTNRDQLIGLLKEHDLDDKLDTPYRGGLFALARLASRRTKLALDEKLLINSAEWSRTGNWSRICYSLPEKKWQEALSRLRRFLTS